VSRAGDGGSFTMGGTTVAPGGWAAVSIPVAPLYNQVMMHLRAHVLRGARPGPCLRISGTIHGIDLHSAAIHRANLPQIRANLDDRDTRRMARAFGAAVSLHSNERDGSLRRAASRRFESYDTTWVRAPRSGYLVLEVALGARLRRHDRIGTLHMRMRDEEHGASDAVIRAPGPGLVIGQATNPLVHVGDAVVHIAHPGGRRAVAG